jgi:hypothetical protein
MRTKWLKARPDPGFLTLGFLTPLAYFLVGESAKNAKIKVSESLFRLRMVLVFLCVHCAFARKHMMFLKVKKRLKSRPDPEFSGLRCR